MDSGFRSDADIPFDPLAVDKVLEDAFDALKAGRLEWAAGTLESLVLLGFADEVAELRRQVAEDTSRGRKARAERDDKARALGGRFADLGRCAIDAYRKARRIIPLF